MSNDLLTAILNASKDQRVQESMLLGSSFEGGWNAPFPVGDQGTSFGPYQMHIGGALTSAGGTPSQAEDPTWATQHMVSAYTNAVNQQPASLWQSNPELAAEQAAVAAERPAKSYLASHGQKTLDQHWQLVQGSVVAGSVLNDPASSNNPITAIGGALDDATGGALSSIANTLSTIGNAVDTIMTFITTKLMLPKTWARVLAFSGGTMLVFIGLYLFFAPAGAASSAVGNVVGAVPK